MSAVPFAAFLIGTSLFAAGTSWSAPAHLFQKNQCGTCHLFPSREGTFLRADAFRRDIVSLCLTCHGRERAGIGHRVGMVPSMRVPEDLPLDAAGRLTCASCHDPHAVEGPNRWLLRRPAGPALCGACHPDGIPEREPPVAAFTFPPEGAVIANTETVVAGTVANHTLTEVRLSTGRETLVTPVIKGSFQARVRLPPGAAKVLLDVGGRQARLHLTVRPAAATWTTHLTGDAGQCAICHPGWETGGFFFAGAPGENCLRCHEGADTLPHRHEPAALGECTICHDPHGSSLAGAAVRQGDAGCVGCHEPASAARHLLEANADRTSAVTDCGYCHDPHQSTRSDLTTATAGSLALPLALEAPAPSLRPGPGGAADVTLAGFALTDDAGRPQVPERIVALAVPPGADPRSARLHVLEARTADLPGTHAVAPAPPAATYADGRTVTEWGSGRTIRDGRDRTVYESNAPWPPEPLTFEKPSGLGDLALVRVAYRPLQYHPASGVLSHTSRVIAEIQFDPFPGNKGKHERRATGTAATAVDLGLANARRARLWSDAARATPARAGSQARQGNSTRAAAAAGMATNDVALDLPGVDSASGPSQPGTDASMGATGNSAAYLIVTTNATAAASGALGDFVAHKAARGLPVKVVTDADFGAATAGQQRAASIRAWLQANAPTLGARYLLLIGNPHPESGDVPMLRAWPRRGATTNVAYLDAPTDAFYADLSGAWDLDGDGYAGEFRDDAGSGGVDFVPELFVGRIPVYGGDTAALDAILRKVIAYESAGGDLSWRRSALLPMSFSDPATDGAWLAEQMKGEFLRDRGFSAWSLYQQGSGGGGSSVFQPDAELRGGSVAEQWGSVPYGLVAWWGHGSASRSLVGYTGAWDGDLLSTPTAALNDAAPAFVYQNACLNGYPESATNLAYNLLRNGAIATVSASRVSWYAVGQNDFRLSATNAGLGYRYVSRLTAGDAAGRALALAKGDPAVSTASDAGWMNLMDFNLYGDPSVSLFPGPSLQVSRGEITLTAAEGEDEPVEAALALTSGDMPVAVGAGAEAAWLGVVPLASQTPATLALTALPSGLAVGAHSTRVLLTSQEAGNAPLALSVTLNVTRAGSIAGRVSDPAESPISNATVALRGVRSRTTATDAAGFYGFERLPPGQYTVEVSGTSYPLRQPLASVSLAEGEQRSLDFASTSHAIRGRVTDASGRPLAKVVVRVYDASGVLLRRAVTNARGAYLISRLGPGDYAVRARLRPWRFRAAPRIVRIRDASYTTRNFVGRR